MQRVRRKLEGKALPVVMFIIFLDILGLGILIPVLPQLLYEIFIPAGHSMAGALIILGWLTAIYPLMQFVSTPILGQLSDRFGRRPVLTVSLAGTALGYLITVIGILTKNVPLIFVGRALDGITGGNISVARAVIADVTVPEHRARNFGLMGAMFGVGFIMGPVIGARLASPNADVLGLFSTPAWFGTATPFWFAAIVSLLTVLLVWACLPETHRHRNPLLAVDWTRSLTNIRKAASRPGLRVIFGAEFLFWGGFTFFTTFFQILLIEKLGFETKNVGDFFAYIGISIALSQLILVRLAIKRFKSHDIVRVGLFGSSLALFAQLWPSNAAELFVVAPLIAVFNGLVMANITALVSLSASSQEQGEMLGIEASVQALAQAIPAIISGYVATMGVNMPVIWGGATIFIGALLFLGFYRVPRRVDRQEAKHELPAPKLS